MWLRKKGGRTKFNFIIEKIFHVITSSLCISLKINAFISYMFYYKLLLPNNMRSLKLQHKVVNVRLSRVAGIFVIAVDLHHYRV